MSKHTTTSNNPVEKAAVTDQSAASERQVSVLKAMLITMTIIFVVCAVALFALYQFGVHTAKGPEVPAKLFVVAVQNNDPKTAYKLTSPSFQKEVNESDFAKILTAQNAVIGTGEVTIVENKTKTTDGFVTATVGVNIGTGSDVMSATLLLTKVDNVWLIANISQFTKGAYAGSTLDPSQ